MTRTAHPVEDFLVVSVDERFAPRGALFCDQEVDCEWSVQETSLWIWCIFHYHLLYLFGTVNHHICDCSRQDVVLEPHMEWSLVPFQEIVIISFCPFRLARLLSLKVSRRACRWILAFLGRCADEMTPLIALTIYWGLALHPRMQMKY